MARDRRDGVTRSRPLARIDQPLLHARTHDPLPKQRQTCTRRIRLNKPVTHRLIHIAVQLLHRRILRVQVPQDHQLVAKVLQGAEEGGRRRREVIVVGWSRAGGPASERATERERERESAGGVAPVVRYAPRTTGRCSSYPFHPTRVPAPGTSSCMYVWYTGTQSGTGGEKRETSKTRLNLQGLHAVARLNQKSACLHPADAAV